MSKLNKVQKNVVKTIESKKSRERMKKLFQEINQEKELLDSKKLLKKLFKTLEPK
jgi:hypothetical protein